MSLLPEDSFDIQILLEHIGEYVLAKKRHDEARDAYTGYSWGYHGNDYIQRVDETSLALKKALFKVIDERVDARLTEQGRGRCSK